MINNIIIFPTGDFGSKLMSLMGAIDLEIKTNKKIKIFYSYSFNDFLFDENSEYFMKSLPEFNFKNIRYYYLRNNLDIESYILSNLVITKEINNTINKISKDLDLKNVEFGIIDNEYPIEDSCLIKKTIIQGFNNKGAVLVKNWLHDVKKFKCYNSFIKNIGFDWYDDKYEYVIIYLEITQYLKFINNNTIYNDFILSHLWYDKALNILKKKINKPLKIIYIDNLRLNSKILHNYISTFKKHGSIINDISNNFKLSQVDILLIMSKVNHYIGSKDIIQVGSFIYSKKNSITIINSNYNIDYSLKKKNYPSNWIILDDKNYRIQSNRDLQNNNLDYLVGLRSFKKDESFQINKMSINLSKNEIKNKYELQYKNFNKIVKSDFLRKLMLYRYFVDNKEIHYLNSNISINEGLFLTDLIKKYKPKRLIEIGFACGISTAFILLSIDKKSTLLSIDPFQKFQWNSFGLKVVNNIIKERNLTNDNHQWIPLYSYKFFNNINKKVDFCFIDGDHSYEGTLIDLEGCNKILEKNGILVIDDVLHIQVKKALNNFMLKNDKLYEKIQSEVKTMNAYKKLK